MISQNRTAAREYELLDKLEAGIVLTGGEVKSIRQRGMKLEDAFVRIIANEAQLINATIQPYSSAKTPDHEYNPQKTRKLLLNRTEILRLQTKLAQSPQLTIVPLSCYTKHGLIKLEIALAKGRKSWQIKRVDKDRTEKRRIDKDIREAEKPKLER